MIALGARADSFAVHGCIPTSPRLAHTALACVDGDVFVVVAVKIALLPAVVVLILGELLQGLAAWWSERKERSR